MGVRVFVGLRSRATRDCGCSNDSSNDTCRNVNFRQQHAAMDSATTNSSLALLLAGMAESDQSPTYVQGWPIHSIPMYVSVAEASLQHTGSSSNTT
jgi:hypothetical protein